MTCVCVRGKTITDDLCVYTSHNVALQDAEEQHLFRVIEESRRLRAEILASDSGTRSEHISSELLKTEQKILYYLKSRRESYQSL